MRKLIVSSIFLFFSQITFAADEKQIEDQLPFVLDHSLRIIVENREEFIIDVSAEKLSKYRYFRNFFSDEKQIEFKCECEGEASALKKIIRFAHENPDTSAGFFEADDFADLIWLSLKHRFDKLGRRVEKFIQSEVTNKLTTYEESPILLDDLSKEQLEYLHEKINSIEMGEIHCWPIGVRKSFDNYLHYLYTKMDPRVSKIAIKFDINTISKVSAVRTQAERKGKKLRVEQVLEREAQGIAAEIVEKVNRHIRSEPCCKSEQIASPRKKHTEMVSSSYANEVVKELKKQLYAFRVSRRMEDWQISSDLNSIEEPWPSSLGGHLATLFGFSANLCVCPCQYLCYFFHDLCCKQSCKELFDEEWFNLRIGGAARHCAYKSCTCGKVPIDIEPKNYSATPIPVISPPHEEMI